MTFKLQEGILWSDGEPLTSRDIQFTWEWITNLGHARSPVRTWGTIDTIETPDELTAMVTFESPRRPGSSRSWAAPTAASCRRTPSMMSRWPPTIPTSCCSRSAPVRS